MSESAVAGICRTHPNFFFSKNGAGQGLLNML
jgi:hypothetical protein